MTNYTKLLMALLLAALSVGTVSADAVTPPDNIRIAAYLSTHNQIGIWWINPTVADFNGTQIWFDDTFIGTDNSTTDFHYWEFLALGDHTFSTHTIDTVGNANASWMNITIANNGYFACDEQWFYYDEYCYANRPCYYVNVTGALVINGSTSWNVSLGGTTWGTNIMNITAGNVSWYQCGAGDIVIPTVTTIATTVPETTIPNLPVGNKPFEMPTWGYVLLGVIVILILIRLGRR